MLFRSVKLLLADSRVDPTTGNNIAIRLAARLGHVDVVKLLLSDLRISSTVDIHAVANLARKNGHLDIVDLLLLSQNNNDESKSTLHTTLRKRRGG